MADNLSFQPEQPEESIDLRKWAIKLLSNWYWFVLSAALFGSIAFVYTRNSTPKYTVSSTILLQQEQNSLSGAGSLLDGDLFGQISNKENERDILKSWSLARRTLENLNFGITYLAKGKWTERKLYENIPFQVTTGPHTQKMEGVKVGVTVLSDKEFLLEIDREPKIRVKHAFGELYQNGDLNFIVSHNPNFNPGLLPGFLRTGKYCFMVNNLDRLAYECQAALSVAFTDKMTSVLRLTMSGSSRAQVVDYLNALMKEYIQSSLELKNQTATNTINFIDDQLNGIKDTLMNAELSLQDFRSRNQLVSVSAEGAAVMTQIDRLAQEKALIDIQVKYYEYLLQYLKGNDDFANVMVPSTMGITDQMISTLITNQMKLQSEKSSLEYSARENNHALIKVNLEIKANRDNLTENVRNVLETTKLRQDDVASRISRVNSRIQELPVIERQLANRTRKFELQNSIYTFLLQNRAEAGIAQASNLPDQLVIDQARLDAVNQVAPQKTRNYAIGLFLGLLFPFGILIAGEFLNQTIAEKKDVMQYTDVPIIGMIGHSKQAHIGPSINYPRSAISESFRAVRTHLQFSLLQSGQKVVMITSSTSGEGKSFVALGLAGIFSVTNKKTVVVGLDLRNPTLENYLNIPNKEGVSTYIVGRSKIESIINPTEFPNLSVVNPGPVPPNPAELFETPRFAELIRELRERFDFVILDTPPVAFVTDAMLVAHHADATLYVVRQNFTHPTTLEFANELKANPNVKQLSILLNDMEVPRYYGKKYGYGTMYRKKYGRSHYLDV
jgi:tyrosine-protein kinase Etk/Wzc